MGPGLLHYMVTTFDGHRVMSEVTSELRAVRRGGLLRLIDLLFLNLAESIEVSDLRGHEVEELSAMLRELVPGPDGAAYAAIVRDASSHRAPCRVSTCSR